MTQFERILSHLRKQPQGATHHDLMMISGGNWPHKRIDESTDSMGNVKRYGNPGERIKREYALHEGRYITVFKLTKA